MQHAKSSSTSTVPDGEKLPVIKGSHVYLIDGSGYIFRAFHALPPLTRPSDGLPVGAVHGFCQMLWKLLRESKVSEAPTHIAVIFDAGRDTFRNDIYPKYKAQRPPPPEELIPQFPLIRDAVKAFNVACIELDRFEADDLIATYAKAAVDAGGDVTIVSSDKDLMQLVRPGVTMFDGMKAKRIGRDEVIEKFGVPPEKVIDVQALAGDSIDNVPGVPGIGIKTAAELIATYGDLDTLLAAGRRDQAAEASRKAHRVCRAGARLASARDAEGRCSASDRHRDVRRAGSQCRDTVELPQNDGVQHADEAHRGRLGRRGAATARRFGRCQPQSAQSQTGANEPRAPWRHGARVRNASGGGCSRRRAGARQADRSQSLRDGDDARSAR